MTVKKSSGIQDVSGGVRLSRKAVVLATILALVSLSPPAKGQSSVNMTTRPVILKGRVVIDDGSPLPEQAMIERVCSGQVQREIYTDSHGSFSFEVGANDTHLVQDASSGGAYGSGAMQRARAPGTGTGGQDSLGPTQSDAIERDLQACELRASLRGFRSESVRLGGRIMSDGKVGTIVLHRAAPRRAEKALARARLAAASGNQQEAQKQLEEAVRLYPGYAEAWVELGLLHDGGKRTAEAQKAFEQALAVDRRYIPAYFHLAVLAADARQWERVAELTDKSLAINPDDFPGLYYYNAAAYMNLQKLERAEASARSARRLDSEYNFPVIDLVLAQILAQQLDYKAAAEQLRTFLKHVPNFAQADTVRAQLATYESKAAEKH